MLILGDINLEYFMKRWNRRTKGFMIPVMYGQLDATGPIPTRLRKTQPLPPEWEKIKGCFVFHLLRKGFWHTFAVAG